MIDIGKTFESVNKLILNTTKWGLGTQQKLNPWLQSANVRLMESFLGLKNGLETFLTSALDASGKKINTTPIAEGITDAATGFVSGAYNVATFVANLMPIAGKAYGKHVDPYVKTIVMAFNQQLQSAKA
jgi:hypothetical protein